MAKNIYELAKKHKFLLALKKHIEKNGHTFEDYLLDRYITRTGNQSPDRKQAAMVEIISLYMMATHASKEALEATLKKLQ
jgi:hypothetical protein